MTPEILHRLVIIPALRELELFDGLKLAQRRSGIDSIEARVMLLAIAVQESDLKARRQLPSGPARSFWQIEPLTATNVLKHWPPAGRFWQALSVSEFSLWALQFNDTAACVIARGILRLDPGPLPPVGDEAGAWRCYIRCWRPGKPKPGKWPSAYMTANREVIK